MAGLLFAVGLATTAADAPPVYGPVMRPRVERAEADQGHRYLASEPESPRLDEADDGVRVKWRGRKVRLRVPLG